MSSSLRYTFTNLCRAPSSPTRFWESPGYLPMRLVNTSPTVAPSAETVDAPSAWVRSRFGRSTVTAMPASYAPSWAAGPLRSLRSGLTVLLRSGHADVDLRDGAVTDP